MNKKYKDLILVIFLIVFIWMIITFNMMGFISGIKGKDNIDLMKLEETLEQIYDKDFTYINRYALDEVIYVFVSGDIYYYVSEDGTVYLEEDSLVFDEPYWQNQLKIEEMNNGSVYLAYYNDDSAVVLEDDSFIKVYDLKSQICYFSFMKRGNE